MAMPKHWPVVDDLMIYHTGKRTNFHFFGAGLFALVNLISPLLRVLSLFPANQTRRENRYRHQR
jgi:hypothetical protein